MINVTAGGGSLLTVGCLRLLMGLLGPVANGTNRIAIIAQSLAAVASFRSRVLRFSPVGDVAFAAASLAFFGASASASPASV
ncbi:MAG: hypothetical protein R3C42_05425 [Parvularculaceae bacterium]